MKAFNVFLNDLNDGSTNAGLTADLEELLRTVQHTGRAGSMTLKIKIVPASKGQQDVDKVNITAERKLELPKPEAPSDFFWLTDNGEPTRQHPRQHALQFAGKPAGEQIDADGVITNPQPATAFKEIK